MDSSGNAYVTGAAASPDFPTTAGAFQPYCSELIGPNACTSAFVTKLDPNGSSLVYSTYLGGTAILNEADIGYAIAVDSAGEAYVGGAAGTADFRRHQGRSKPALRPLTT